MVRLRKFWSKDGRVEYPFCTGTGRSQSRVLSSPEVEVGVYPFPSLHVYTRRDTEP